VVNRTGKNTGAIVIDRIAIVLVITAVLLVLAALGAILLVCKGPSPTAAGNFAASLRQTSAVGFLADVFFTPEELEALEGNNAPMPEYEPTDVSLISIADDETAEPTGDEYGYEDEDGDGIIVVPVKGTGYSGYMMIVLDPTRVTIGCVPSQLGRKGYTVQEFAEQAGAVAAINGGGFEDANGQGNGSVPNSLIVCDGEIYYGEKGIAWGFGGIDSSGVLHVAHSITTDEIKRLDIRSGCCYGPVLVKNGVGTNKEYLSPGINPRTAIGQRADGAMLLLVIDGRQVISLGATYADLEDIMLEFGAVNAVNLDGGSSTMMWYNGKYVNNSASVIGIRKIPSAFVVLKEGAA